MSENSLGEAVLDLVADGSGLIDDIDKTKPRVLSALDGLGKVGGAILGTALAGAAALGGFLATTISPASDLNETISKTNVIFGDSAKEILAWADTAASAMGASRKEALDAVGSFGTFGKSAGLAGKDLTRFVEDNAQLASDLASFWNTSTQEAQTAIQAAFRGETEPIRKYGVMLDDASLRQKAMKMGIVKTTKDALTPQQKVLAVNALLWEQTTDAQGDFARTSDGLANKQRIVAAQFENIRAQLGMALLPAIQAITAAFSDWLSRSDTQVFLQQATQALASFATMVVEQLPNIITGFQNFVAWLQNNQGVVVAILAVIGASLLAFGVTAAIAAWTALSPLLPIIAVIALIGAAAYLLYTAWTENWGGIQEKTASFWAWLQPLLQQLWDWLAINVPLAFQTLANFWTTTLQPALSELWNWLATNIPAAIQTLANFWKNTLYPAILWVWSWMNQVLFPFFQSLGNFFNSVFGVALTALAGIWQNVLYPALREVYGILATYLMPIFKSLSDWWNTSGSPMAAAIAHWFGDVIVQSFKDLTKQFMDVTRWLQDITNKLNSMHLPSWMTPGSPTPWEIGLWGIDDALQAVSGVSLPSLSANLGAMPAPALATSSVMAGLNMGGAPVQFVYSPMISTADEYEAKRVLGPFIDERMRQARKQ